MGANVHWGIGANVLWGIGVIARWYDCTLVRLCVGTIVLYVLVNGFVDMTFLSFLLIYSQIHLIVWRK